MKELVLIRGLPGSGKSTIAKAMAGYTHFETDQYFTYPHGVYRFDPTKLKVAHAWCQACVEAELAAGYSVVVANTFTQIWEIEPYLAIAERKQASVRVITAKGNFQSVHDVPKERIEAMRKRWEDF